MSKITAKKQNHTLNNFSKFVHFINDFFNRSSAFCLLICLSVKKCLYLALWQLKFSLEQWVVFVKTHLGSSNTRSHTSTLSLAKKAKLSFTEYCGRKVFGRMTEVYGIRSE